MGQAGYFRQLAYNNAWANYRLSQACGKLSQADFEAPRTSFFPSLKATLNHILVVDWFYVDALEGGTLGPDAWRVEEPCASAEELAGEQHAVDRRLIAVCADLSTQDTEREIRLVRETRTDRERMDRVLLHLFHHQTHHRGQVHAMLAGTPVKPPQIDEFFMAGEAGLRQADLSALGFSEETVWDAD